MTDKGGLSDSGKLLFCSFCGKKTKTQTKSLSFLGGKRGNKLNTKMGLQFCVGHAGYFCQLWLACLLCVPFSLFHLTLPSFLCQQAKQNHERGA